MSIETENDLQALSRAGAAVARVLRALEAGSTSSRELAEIRTLLDTYRRGKTSGGAK